MIEAGKLNKKLILQQPTDNQSDSGEVSLNWVDVGPVWANIAPIGARELELAKGFAGTVSHKITIRYRTVTNSMRLSLGSRYFYINGAVDPTGLSEDLIIYSTEVTN